MKEIYLVSERGPHFWGTRQLAEETQYAKLVDSQEEILPSADYDEILNSLRGKKVLVYIHGLKNTQSDVVKSHKYLQQNFDKFQPNSSLYSKFLGLFETYFGSFFGLTPTQNQPYDAIIGYSWPSYEEGISYFAAKEHAITLAPKFAAELEKITKVAKKTDILAHSMGNLLLFESLAHHGNSNHSIDHIYSIAAAVPDDSFSPNHQYSKVLDYAKQIFVFHSEKDYVLGWPYYYAENSTLALGLLGPKKSPDLPSHIKIVDVSSSIQGHGRYLVTQSFYDFLFKVHNQELDIGLSQFQI